MTEKQSRADATINTKKLTVVTACVLLAVLVMAVIVMLTQPGQFDEEISDTVEKVVSQTSDFTLAIVTDIHYDPTKYAAGEVEVLDDTFACIDEVKKGIEERGKRIDAFWNLGDFINGHDTTKKDAIAQIQTVINEQGKVSPDFHNIAGNHDNNIQATYEGNANLPDTEVLSSYELNDVLKNTETTQEEHYNPNWPTDYYVEFETIRIICVSADCTTFRRETVDWLKREALDTEKEILILSHIPTRPEWGFKEDVVHGEAVEAVIRDFVSDGGTVVAFIHGHDHGDMISQVKDDDGSILFSEVAVACARFHYPKSEGTPGMKIWERNEEDKTKLLFEMLTIDQNKREVHFIRFGAGEDRVLVY